MLPWQGNTECHTHQESQPYNQAMRCPVTHLGMRFTVCVAKLSPSATLCYSDRHGKTYSGGSSQAQPSSLLQRTPSSC